MWCEAFGGVAHAADVGRASIYGGVNKETAESVRETMATPVVTEELLMSIRDNGVKAVSFDIFDTAIARRVFEPHDLFVLVERIVNRKEGTDHSFADMRIEAERLARGRADAERRQEVTLDDIYGVLRQVGFSDLACDVYRAEEIAAEVASAYPVNGIKEAYSKVLGLGIPVVFTSDIYLPQDVIEEMLARCGYESYTGVWLSSTVGKTKAKGDLFPELVTALMQRGVISKATQLLHIGDNAHSDIRQAGRHGITTYHVQRPAEQLRQVGLCQGKLDESFEPFASGPMRLERSVILGVLVREWVRRHANGETHRQVSAYDIGFNVAGPLLYGFVDWLHQQCQQQKHGTVYFLARDGLIFKKAFDLLTAARKSGIRSEYVYASRRCCYLPALETLDSGAEEILCRTWSTIPASEFIRRLGLDVETFRKDIEDVFGDLDALVAPEDTRPRMLFTRIFDRILPIINEERQTLTAYLEQKGLFQGTAAICDIGYRGSMQAAIKRLAQMNGKKIDVVGYYFATVQFPIWAELRTKGWICDQGIPSEHWKALEESIAMIELFFTAQHGSVIKMVGGQGGQFEPVVVAPCSDEETRFEMSRDIQAGAIAFVHELIGSGWGAYLDITPALALCSWISMVTRPTEAVVDVFKHVKHNDGFGSSSFKPIVSPLKLANLLCKRRATLEEFSKNNWRKGSLAASSHPARVAVKLDGKLRHLIGRYRSVRVLLYRGRG